MIPVETLNYFVGVGTIILQVLTLVFFAAYILRGSSEFFRDIGRPVAEWGIWIAFVASLVAVAMSLYYELVVGYPPCVLCWWQRVFMYPQVILFAVALWTRDRTIALTSIILSVIGLAIGVYNHLLQVMPGGALPCPAQGVSCAQIFYLEFGYVTFPMLSITFFAFLIVVMLHVRSR